MENQKGHRAFQGSVSVRILSVPKKAIFRSFVFFLKLRLKKSLKRPIGCAFTRIRSKLTFIDGPSDRIRTCGILLPKQARYQLRYTRLLSYFIRLVVFSQTRRDTNFAIPGYSLFCHDTTASGKNKDFSVCGHSCGQSRFCAVFDNRGKSRKRRRRKAFRRFTLPRPGYSHGTPKASALPTALHPDTVFTLHRKSVFDSPNSILDFGRKVNRPVAYPARIAYNKNITQYIKERAL